VSYTDGAAHDLLAAEREMDLAAESGDPARIEATHSGLDEAFAAWDEAYAEAVRLDAAQAEAELADRMAAIWDDPEPEPLEHPAAEPEAEPSGDSLVVRPEYLGWAAEPAAGTEPQALGEDQLYVGMTRGREVPEPEAQAGTGWQAVWAAADSAVYQARAEAGLEPDAEMEPEAGL
jgi:hypothetical protein